MHHVFFVYDTKVTNQGNGIANIQMTLQNLLLRYMPSATLHFSSGEHVAGETGDYGEVSVQLVYTGAYQCSINVDTLTRKPTGKMLQVGEIVLTKSKRVHFIALTLKDGHFPDSRFTRTLSKTFQSEKIR